MILIRVVAELCAWKAEDGNDAADRCPSHDPATPGGSHDGKSATGGGSNDGKPAPGGLGDVTEGAPSAGEPAPAGLVGATPATGGPKPSPAAGTPKRRGFQGLLPPRKLAFSPTPTKCGHKVKASPKSKPKVKAEAKAKAKAEAKAKAKAEAKAKATAKAKASAKAKAKAKATAEASASTPELEQQEAPSGESYAKKKAYCNERQKLIRLANESYKPRRPDSLTEKDKFFRDRLRELVATRSGEAKDYFKEVSQAWRELCKKQVEAEQVVAQRDVALLALVPDGAGAGHEELQEAGVAQTEVAAPDTEPVASAAPADRGLSLSSPAAVGHDVPTEGQQAQGLSLKSQRLVRRKVQGKQAASPEPLVPEAAADQLQAPETQGPESERQGAQELQQKQQPLPREENSQELTLDDLDV